MPKSIGPTEYLGEATISEDGELHIGELAIPFTGLYTAWPDTTKTAGVYVRRLVEDGSVYNILISQGDGFAQEALDAENAANADA